MHPRFMAAGRGPSRAVLCPYWEAAALGRIAAPRAGVCDGCRHRRRARLAGLGRRAWRALRTRKAARCLAAAATLVVYVRLRSFLAVDQLVRIYREVGAGGPCLPVWCAGVNCPDAACGLGGDAPFARLEAARVLTQ